MNSDSASTDSDLDRARQDMVTQQLERRGIHSAAVLAAMGSVPRELFIPEHLRQYAYDDSPLPIAAGQTISQPYIVAYMIEALQLKGGEKVLEIGAGSGYAAAVLARIAREVISIERIKELADGASAALAAAGCDNARVIHGDGTLGWEAEAPFDGIVVTAGGPEVPAALKHQLSIGGCLVMPVGSHKRSQELLRVRRTAADEFESEHLLDVRFVPLLGEQGWRD